MKKQHCKTEIYTDNSNIENKDCTAIVLKNQGKDEVVVFDNLLLKPDESFSWSVEDSNTIIDNDIKVIFKNTDADKQLLVMRIYTK